MGNHDILQAHIVVCNCDCGPVVMTTKGGSPAVFRHPEDAELLRAQLADIHAPRSFSVITCPVL